MVTFIFTGGGLDNGLDNLTLLMIDARIIDARIIDALLYWDLSRSDRGGELKNHCPHLKSNSGLLGHSPSLCEGAPAGGRLKTADSSG